MRGGYLATEPSRYTSCCVGSLTNSGITVKECAGHSGLKSQSANISWAMRFEECCPRLRTAAGSKRVSTNGRSLFSCTRPPSEHKRRETSASREHGIRLYLKLSSSLSVEVAMIYRSLWINSELTNLKGCEPHEPVESVVIRGNNTRPSLGITGFTLKLIFLPNRSRLIWRNSGIPSPLEYNFCSFLCYATKNDKTFFRKGSCS